VEQGLKVLEIGCGTGRWAKEVLESAGCRVANLVALDASETMALEAASRLSGEPRAQAVRADVRRRGETAQVCRSVLGAAPDRIVMNYVLDLLDDPDADAVLAECHGLLAESGGKLAVCAICDGGAVMGAWRAVWEVNPTLVGGCRPIDLASRLTAGAWRIEAEEQVEVLGYSSQVIVATPME